MISQDSMLVVAIAIGVPFLLTVLSRIYNRTMLRKAGYIAAMPQDFEL